MLFEFWAGWLARSSGLIAGGMLVLWLLRAKDARIRLAALMAILAGSFAMPLLVPALPPLPVALPGALMRKPSVIPAAPRPAQASAFAARPVSSPPPLPRSNVIAPGASFDWLRFAVILYSIVAAALLLRLFAGFAVGMRILRRSGRTDLGEGEIEVRESASVASPAAIGIFRPRVLVPPDWREWPTMKLSAVLAHEGSHIRRRDPLLQFVSAIHRALLWASPFSWLLHRSIVRASEAISDADAIAATGDRILYAEILLDFIQRGLGQANWLEVPMAGYDRPATRVRRILESSVVAESVRGRGLAPVLLLGASLAYLAAAVHPYAASSPPGPIAKPVPLAQTVAPAVVTPDVDAAPAPASVTADNAPAADPQLPSSPSAATPTAPGLLRFEVASVKRSEPGSGHSLGVALRPGTVEIYGVNARNLVEIAFHLVYWQVTGGESWADNDTYDIVARPPEKIQAGIKDLRYTWFAIEDARLREMLLSLLIDRFQLQYHRETRTGEVRLLERNAKPVALTEQFPPWGFTGQSAEAGAIGTVGYAGGEWTIFATSMPQLAGFASEFILHVPVFDRTELAGSFNYRQLQPDLEPRYGGDQSDSFVNFLSEAGLKLEKSQGPVETVAIDRLSKPTPN